MVKLATGDKTLEKKATRAALGATLAELAREAVPVVAVDADLSGSTTTKKFADADPAFADRLFNCGIAEQNMIGAAAGLAAMGLVPFASSFAMFAAGRAFEQVRNSVGYPHLNVKIGATHGGISVGEDGATHQCCEDFALMRSIPGMTVISPADDTEARAVVKAAAEYEGPVYMRFGRAAVEDVYDPATYKFEWGKGITVRGGHDVTVIANGLLVGEALKAAAELEVEGISVRVIDMHTIKPIDRELVLKAAGETGAIVTAEEHNILGGLGSAVCEVVAEECPVPVLRVGVNDVFGKSGPAAEVLNYFGLNAVSIADKARAILSMKKQ